MLENIKDKLNAILSKLKGKHLTADLVEKILREVRIALLEADVHYKAASDLIAAIKEKAVGEKVLQSLTPYQQIIDIVYKEFTSVLGGKEFILEPQRGRLNVWEIVGLQGSGKTTNTAKIAYFFKAKGFKVIVASCDVNRPAAIEQLRILAKSNGLDFFENSEKKAAAIAKKAREHAERTGCELLLLDTAGRLHIDKDLMDEALDIKKLAKADEIVLVVDAMIGQQAAVMTKEFHEKLSVTGAVLTKLDSDTRGGAALSVRHISGAPVIFAGTGEKIGDLEYFYPERVASRILGMGDLLTLIEKSKESFDEEKAKESVEKLLKAEFNFNDYLEQMKELKKMGSLESLMEMIPGFSSMNKQMRAQIPTENDLKHIEAMILSMTPAERIDPRTIDFSRRKRIAKGSGNSLDDVNRFIKNFEMSKKMMKKSNFKKMFKNMNFPM